MAATINVSVIVPSTKRTGYWEDVADQTLTAENMEDGTDKLRNGHVGLTVFVGKYDGVDLPAKACELLIIDGLPEVSGLIERIEQAILDGTRRQLVRQIQRIEQGMGRGVRSSQDHCVVLLIGSRLTERLHNPEARSHLTVATRAQLDLGREVTIQVKGQPIAEIEKVMRHCLDRDDRWVDASRNAIVNAEEGEPSHIDAAVVLLRSAFDSARAGRFDDAEDSVQKAIEESDDQRAKGYLKQQLAEYVHHTNPVKAQEIQLSAVQLNRALVRPIKGLTYSKLSVPKTSQAVEAFNQIQRFHDNNEMLLWVNSLIEAFAWGEENSNQFEAAMYKLGVFLGFGSQRPENDVGKGPDNLWALGELEFLVIECKSGAVIGKNINKHDCNQLNGSMQWFANQYDKSCHASPVMVHPKLTPEHAASLNPETRIINEDRLSKLLGDVRSYAIAVSRTAGSPNPKTIVGQLQHFGLTRADFVSRFTVRFKA